MDSFIVRKNLKTIAGKLAVFSLLFALVLSVMPVSPVSAALRSCRGDPKFYLSNGGVVTAAATIYSDAANVSNAAFVLHAPKGLSLSKIVYTTKTVPETGSVVFDQAAGVYWVDVYVTSKVSGVSVTATAQLNSGAVKTVSGLTGQHLKITLP